MTDFFSQILHEMNKNLKPWKINEWSFGDTPPAVPYHGWLKPLYMKFIGSQQVEGKFKLSLVSSFEERSQTLCDWEHFFSYYQPIFLDQKEEKSDIFWIRSLNEWQIESLDTLCILTQTYVMQGKIKHHQDFKETNLLKQDGENLLSSQKDILKKNLHGIQILHQDKDITEDLLSSPFHYKTLMIDNLLSCIQDNKYPLRNNHGNILINALPMMLFKHKFLIKGIGGAYLPHWTRYMYEKITLNLHQTQQSSFNKYEKQSFQVILQEVHTQYQITSPEKICTWSVSLWEI
jgi:hypothetical protein